ncbi:MAG: penicillin-binding protein activator [Deltaproteobacteria bacterium]|nr:penicillin-binding protein activator [Deltaproteobacteria bacterium]
MRSVTRYQAISATLVVGIAFFLQSCVSVKPIERPVKPPAKAVLPAPVEKDEFVMAESAREAGYQEEALELYGAYLEKYPDGKDVAQALRRMGDIYYNGGEYSDALRYYERLAGDFPEYPDRPEITYRMISIYTSLGHYQASRYRALEWIKQYPADPLAGRVYNLLGLDYAALQDSEQAFFWWLRAEKETAADPRLQSEIRGRVVQIIETSDIDVLGRLLQYASGTDFVPPIYYRLATLYLEEDDFADAREAAMALVRSTPEQTWVNRGRELLERIEEGLSVKTGTFGCLLPLSGPFAPFGEEVLNGIQLGLGVFGSTGGNGPRVEILIKDTEGNPEKASAAMETLVKQEHVIGVIGPLSSKASVAAARVAEKLGVPIITLTQREGITGEGKMVFRNFLVPSREIKKIISAAVDDLGLKRFAILYPENPYGRFFMNKFWDGVEEAGAAITAVESYKPDQTDFADQIKKMTGLYYPRPASLVKKLREMKTPYELETEIEPEEPQPIIDFDAVFIPDTYQRVIMIAPQLMYYDVTDVQLIGTSVWQSPKLIEMAGKYVQGAIFPSGFFKKQKDPEVRAFVRSYEENFRTEPGILGATGYDTAGILKAVMNDFTIRTRNELRKALVAIQQYHGVTGNISFDPQGEVEKEPLILTISGRHMTVFH